MKWWECVCDFLKIRSDKRSPIAVVVYFTLYGVLFSLCLLNVEDGGFLHFFVVGQMENCVSRRWIQIPNVIETK